MIPLSACDIKEVAREIKEEDFTSVLLRLIEISNQKNSNPPRCGFELVIYNKKAYRIDVTKLSDQPSS